MTLKESLARIVSLGKRRFHILVILLGIGIVFLQYNPVWLHPGQVFFGGKEDGSLCFYVYNWGLETIGKGRWSEFWNPPFFYPNTMVSAYTENTLFPVVLGLFPYWATKSALVSYNAVIFINLVLFFTGIFLFGSTVSGSTKAGLFAALCGIFADFLMVQSAHAQNLFIGFVPFIFLFLFKWYKTFRIRYLWFCVAAFSVTGWSNLYYFTFCLFLTFVAAICFFIARRPAVSRRVAVKGIPPLIVLFASVLPVLYPYIAIGRQIAEQRGNFFVPAVYSANLLEFIGVRKFSTNWETTVFMGPVLTFLVALSIWYWFYRARKNGWQWRRILQPAAMIDNHHYAGIVLIMLVMAAAVACGPAIRLGRWWLVNPNPVYAVYYYLIPGSHGTRAIGRIMLMAIPLFSALCAEGLWAAVKGIGKNNLLFAMAVVFVFSTSQFVPTAFGSAMLKTDMRDLRHPGERMIWWFQTHYPVQPIAIFPFAGATPGYTGKFRGEWESQNVWFARIVKRPMINGYSGYFPPSYKGMESLWKKEKYQFTDAIATALKALHCNTVIVDRELWKDFQISSVHPRFRFQSEASGDAYAVFTVE